MCYSRALEQLSNTMSFNFIFFFFTQFSPNPTGFLTRFVPILGDISSFPADTLNMK